MIKIFSAKSGSLPADATHQALQAGASGGEGQKNMEKEKGGRKLIGTIVSDKMQKTAVIAITSMKIHPKYKKFFKVTKKFKAHNENNEYHTGDKVVIQETRPMSREKRWIIISKA